MIQNKIKKDGFDGAITMRLIDVDKETVYQRNGINRFPNNYWDFSNYYYDSLIYYMSALTETTDPKWVNKMTADVTQVVYKQMIKDGIIK